MDFFEAVQSRRSVRKYTTQPVPPLAIEKALNAALLAPNSSNMQTWNFYWVKSARKKSKLVEACLSQSAASTAQELVVIVASPSVWKQNQKRMLELLGPQAAPALLNYYSKLVTFMYGYRWLAPFKWLLFNVRGIFKPTPRGPWSFRDVQEVSIKSAALAAENFMLAITAQGLGCCPMEGFDESRVKRLLNLKCSARVVMVISVGYTDPVGIWGPQIRFDRDNFIHEV